MTHALSSRRSLLAGGAALAGSSLLPEGRAWTQVAPQTRTGPRAPPMVFTGGPILTMEDAMPTAEAIAVRDGVIVAVGALAEARRAAGTGARTMNLDGQTLLPGFFDPHGHVPLVGLQARYANLLPPPDGEGTDIAALQRITRAWMDANEALVRETQLVIGFGYDESQLKEHRDPTAEELDAISESVPILFLHQSGHVGSANNAALAAAGVTAATPNPEGGVFVREPGSQQPNGVMQENALFQVMGVLFKRLNEQENLEMIREGARFYSTFGYTTAQDGRSSTDTCRMIGKLADGGELPIDILSFPDILTSTDVMATPLYRPNYVGKYRIGGVKLTLDGSPQAKTAWLSQPYYVPPPGQPSSYRGYPAVTEQQALDAVELAFRNDWQIEVHANGDAAIDLLIGVVRDATGRHGAKDRRPVLVHGQTTRIDQLDAIKELGIVPSFFPMHTFYWGDWHRESVLGPRRAETISPCASAFRRGMRFTTHHDAPVANPDSMRVLSATVTRRTRSRDILGADERVSVEVALKAMTIWAAWQHFEDGRKGSLARGKLADLVILDRNPLTAEPDSLASILPQATFKEGVEVWRR